MHFLCNPYGSHTSMKNSVSMFHAPYAPLHDPHIAPYAKTKVLRFLSQRTFYGIRNSPTPSMKNSASMFRPGRHRNELCDPQIPPNAKTQVRRKLSRRVFCGIRMGPTRARKILRRHFTSQTHRKALRDVQIPPDATHKVGVTCPSTLFVESIPVPHEHEK
jgi:hypothetical protein